MNPSIPDHEILRVIGRGSYGEIWLARGLTGALRAVKVVWRATFDSERSFQREFSGMAAFEPISREHSGFVQVLHVGRDPQNTFFYYIMELADDATSGRRIDPENYQPHTLANALPKGERLPAAECVRLGISLAQTLAVLHGHGLTHRDIKPANIIFVNGEPKLADIGLVAASGQRSFVGTEGYVPPEGPGTTPADLYSLGKVLYEIAMGQDRLEFPTLPADLDEWDDKPAILRLNAVLLRACANQVDRRPADAATLARELAAVPSTPALHPRHRLALALLVLLAIGFFLYPGSAPERLAPPPSSTAEPAPAPRVAAFGSLRVESLPEAAEISVQGPLAHPPEEQISPRSGTAPVLLEHLPAGEYRITARIADLGVEQTVQVTAHEEASALLRFTNGSLKLTSAPLGAIVLHNGVEIGRTPLLVEDLPPGEVHYELRQSGHRTATVNGRVQAGAQTFLAVRLQRKRIVEPGTAFTNSLGRRLIPLEKIWVANTEAQIAEFLAYAEANDVRWRRPDFNSSDSAPVVNVSWSDAVEFCRWLTLKERTAERIDAELEYRLPTDLEWSAAVGLPEEGGETPEQRDGKVKGHFPWGTDWPPPDDAGNYGLGTDEYHQTAPCASFRPNAFGLYDLGGNVWEWCLDSYNNGERDWGVLRGGSWANRQKPELLSSYRNVIDRKERDVLYGFRYVLAPVAQTRP